MCCSLRLTSQVKSVNHQSNGGVVRASNMLRADAIGWRLLLLLLFTCSIIALPQSNHLLEEWEESIEGSKPIIENQNTTAQPQFDEMSSDSNSSRDASEDDGAAADAPAESASFSEEKAAAPDWGPSHTLDAEWVLPATQVIVLSVMALMVIGILSSATTLMITSEAARVGILLAIAGPIIAISQRGENGTFTRGRILGYVEANPGIHFSALRDALETANGVCAHHLKVLEKEGRIISWLDGRIRRFASSGIDPKRMADLQHPVTGMQSVILSHLAQSGELGMSSSELIVKLESSRQLMNHHMRSLKERGFVDSSGRGRASRWHILPEGRRGLEAAAHLN